MALVKVKAGVKPELLVIVAALANVAQDTHDVAQIVITSGTDGKHMEGSKHDTGEAIDVRTRNFPSTQAIYTFAVKMRRRLGANYQVIIERDHIHVEYDPLV